MCDICCYSDTCKRSAISKISLLPSSNALVCVCVRERVCVCACVFVYVNCPILRNAKLWLLSLIPNCMIDA